MCTLYTCGGKVIGTGVYVYIGVCVYVCACAPIAGDSWGPGERLVPSRLGSPVSALGCGLGPAGLGAHRGPWARRAWELPCVPVTGPTFAPLPLRARRTPSPVVAAGDGSGRLLAWAPRSPVAAGCLGSGKGVFGEPKGGSLLMPPQT